MIKVKVIKKNLERALKELKSKFIKTKVGQQYRENKEFVKPSVKKRKKKIKAIYVQNKKRNEEK
jgi:small subunit ribosomal protein S21